MKIIFLGHTSVHAALIAANIYLGQLQDDGLCMTEGLADVSYDLSGRPLYIGTDEAGTEVYTLGGGKDLWMVKRSINDLRDILGFKPEELIIETISSRWDWVLGVLMKIPPFIGGSHINYWASKILLSTQIDQLNQAVAKMKTA